MEKKQLDTRKGDVELQRWCAETGRAVRCGSNNPVRWNRDKLRWEYEAGGVWFSDYGPVKGRGYVPADGKGWETTTEVPNE